jgi:hypothetical protein
LPLASDPHAARVYGFVAREARKATLLRRGPSKQVRLLCWDLETDTIEAGQWLKGRIYERRCDLSPDGSLFAYFAAKHRGPVAAWTAVCRPPMLTALSFFPKDDCWGGGGLFEDGKSLRLNHTFDKPIAVSHPANKTPKTRKTPRYMRISALRPWEEPGLEGVPQSAHDGAVARNALNLRISALGEHSGRGEDNPIEDMRLRRDGWTIIDTNSTVTKNRRAKTGECSYVLDPPAVRQKPVGGGMLRLQVSLHGIHEQQGRWHVETMELCGPSGTVRPFGRVDWADADHNGDVLYADAGCIYRLRAKEDSGVITGEAQLIEDLNAMTFEAVPRAITPPPAL